MAGLVAHLLLLGAGVSPAAASVPSVPWSAYLPGWSDQYVASSANDCVAGRASCLTQTRHELVLPEDVWAALDRNVHRHLAAGVHGGVHDLREIPHVAEVERHAQAAPTLRCRPSDGW